MKDFSDLKHQAIKKINTDNKKISITEAHQEEIENLRIYQVELEMQNEELIQSRDQLEKSQKYFSDLFDHAPVAYLILSLQITILDLNQMASQLFGFQKKTMLQQRFQSYVPQQTIVSLKKCISDLIETQQKQSSEILFVKKNGRRFWGKMTISQLEHPDKGMQILCSLIDITYEKESQQVINALQLLKEVLNVIPLPVFYTDDQGKLIGFNRCFTNYTGLAEKQLLQSQASDIILKDSEHKRDIMDIKQFTVGTIQTYEIEFQHADQSFRNITLKLDAYQNTHYRLSGIIGVLVDITRHHLLQQELEASIERVKLYAQKAEEASILKSQFLANMSHEIRTPMNAIMGMLEILLSTTTLTNDQEEFIQVAFDSAQNLLVIINDILDFSKIEAQKITLDQKSFDLFKLLRTLYKAMRMQASQKSLVFQLDIHPDVNQYWKGDPHRIRQILVNIVANAIKFTEKGSVKILITQKETDPPKHDTALLCCEVSDTGEGIPSDKKSLIFDSFTQIDGSHTRKHGGTGLGLSISKQLCELMGGEITFDSTPGKGTTFRFCLALTPIKVKVNTVDTRSITAVNAPVISKAIKHVLLAEDIDSNIKVATIILKRLGIAVTVAKNGFQVIEHLKKESFDCILMDIEMPGMSGFEATNRIRAGKAGDHNMDITIIAMTAHAISGFEDKCLQAGMDAYISKPIRFETLRQILGQFQASDSKQIQPSPIISILELMAEFESELFVSEVLEHAQNDMKKFKEQMDNAYIQKDYDNLKYIVHAIKGVGKNIRAENLIEHAVNVENILNNENSDLLAEAFSGLQDSIREVSGFIDSRLENVTASS